MPVKKKDEPTVEPVEPQEVAPEEVMSFYERYHAFCAYVREKAPDVLKFDSNVSNIDYDYVDTQQYKAFVGACADACGISFSWATVGMPLLRIETNDKGRQCFIITIQCLATFWDKFSDQRIEVEAAGMGISMGNNYALSVAQTNAMRNFITNSFLLPTNDRELDDMKSEIDTGKFLTDKQKEERRTVLLESTKSVNEHATIMYGSVVSARILAALEKELPADFREQLEKFLETKYTKIDGVYDPIPVEGTPDAWIVKKKGANKLMSDLDEYNG